MGAVLALTAYIAACAWDCFCTIRVMQKNPAGELNPLVTKLSAKTDIWMGTVVGVGLPSILIGTIGLYCHPILYLATGARVMYGYLQYLSYKRGWI